MSLMVTFYYRKDNGSLWRKTTIPTQQELMHLSCADGLVPWGMVDVDDFLIDHIEAGHCLCLDGKVIILPESEWPEVIYGIS